MKLLLSFIFLVYLIVLGFFVPPSDEGGTSSLASASLVEACESEKLIGCVDAILLTGAINENLKNSFYSALQINESKRLAINTVCFDSRGGEIKTALEIAGEIKRRKMNTCVAEHYEPMFVVRGSDAKISAKKRKVKCASACPFLFLSGNERILIGDSHEFLVHRTGAFFYGHKVNVPWGGYMELIEVSGLGSSSGIGKFHQLALGHSFREREMLRVDKETLVEMNVVTSLVR